MERGTVTSETKVRRDAEGKKDRGGEDQIQMRVVAQHSQRATVRSKAYRRS